MVGANRAWKLCGLLPIFVVEQASTHWFCRATSLPRVDGDLSKSRENAHHFPAAVKTPEDDHSRRAFGVCSHSFVQRTSSRPSTSGPTQRGSDTTFAKLKAD